MLRVIPFRTPFKLALTFVFLTAPLVAHAGGTAAAAAIASAAAAALSDKEPLVAGQSFGATGYLFVDGVGYSGGRMVYCPASVGFVKPEDMFWSKNKITKGVCQSITGDLPAVPAQDFIDEVLGKGEATVVSVAPVLVQHGPPYGVIYYKDNGNEESTRENLRKRTKVTYE
ncbi:MULTISPECIES: hypothetical protein [Pseudomonas]|nr:MULTISPECIES: hypothetical protein [Pseudomonas]EMZ44020.1 hypothetical protein HMPREF1223_13949 [Pseudomonas aeruginosa str. Stone 130]KSD71159.1 hypothetical protein AO903_16180 [Pseudomonas aeruginosa]KXG13651.1 hypothetical protein LT17_05024 [Pseudomonas aeruginosa]MBM9950713.1 hypothetical protein [Pseudomonas aeruginosa]MBM9974640.1 hypothetical protein [Pseudomonas aeruginosa]